MPFAKIMKMMLYRFENVFQLNLTLFLNRDLSRPPTAGGYNPPPGFYATPPNMYTAKEDYWGVYTKTAL